MTDLAFHSVFNRPSEASVFVPGRVNLIGEHTDYNGGLVLPTVIAPGITLSLARNALGYDQFNSSLETGIIKRKPNSVKTGNFGDYIGGMLDALRQISEPTFDIHVQSTLPHGAGVSSSAALMVAVGKAFRTITEIAMSDMEIAQTAQRVENQFLGVPCGLMDQMAVALCPEGHAIKIDTSTQTYDLIPLLKGYRFCVFHSGVTRSLQDGRYQARFDECAKATALLGRKKLCAAPASDENDLEKLPEPLKNRATHVIDDHARVQAFANALLSGDATTCGALLNAGHRSYADLFEASTPEIEALQQALVKAGALGARLTGGGFGGCLVALIDQSAIEGLWAKIQPAFPAARLVAG